MCSTLLYHLSGPARLGAETVVNQSVLCPNRNTRFLPFACVTVRCPHQWGPLGRPFPPETESEPCSLLKVSTLLLVGPSI